MPVAMVINKGKPVKVWTTDIDLSAIEQLENMSRMPFIHKHIAAMPDVHWGMGATIGSVIPSKGAIIPAAVGVDIGCGMNAVRLSLTADTLPDNLRKVRDSIEKAVPTGFSGHEHPKGGDWYAPFSERFNKIIAKHEKVTPKDPAKWIKQMGTLGGGNHFIELCIDENNNLWVMLHSGSRGIGNIIGTYFINKAKQEMERMFISLPDKNLAYLIEGSRLFDDYMEAVGWAQDYALENRRQMMGLVVGALREHLPKFKLTEEAINCHHNYVARENHFNANVYVTRKGAIRAREGDLGIIPGSMGAKSFIVQGKGNKDSFCSCSHGAGRKLGRKEAKRLYTADDLAEQTKGIECPKDDARVDEIPAAYKSIDKVMADQADLVDIVHTLKQVVNVKG